MILGGKPAFSATLTVATGERDDSDQD